MTFHRAADAKGMTLTEFLDRHTSTELTEIIARDRLEPFDTALRIELAVARLCSLVYWANRTGNMEAKSSDEFRIIWGSQYREEIETPVQIMTPEQMRDAFRITSVLFEAKEKRKRGGNP